MQLISIEMYSRCFSSDTLNRVGPSGAPAVGCRCYSDKAPHATAAQCMFALMLHHKRSRLLAGGRQLHAAAFLWSLKHTINDQTRWYLGYTQCSSRIQPNNINNKNRAIILFNEKQWSELSFCGLRWVLTTVHSYATSHTYVVCSIIFVVSLHVLWCFNFQLIFFKNKHNF
jgi:hypothetical protein